MPSVNASRATVRHSLLVGKKIPDCLTTLGNVCTAGNTCTAVQNSPVAKQALAGLQAAVTTASGSLTARLTAAQVLLAAIKSLNLDFGAVRLALRSYEAVVGGIANGDASIINKAGLLSRDSKPTVSVLDKVPIVHTKQGKHPSEAVLSWPRGPGATSYAIEVNYNPATPAGPWVALISGTGRRRVVKTPMPASQMLARIASVGGDGTMSEWSDVVLVTTT